MSDQWAPAPAPRRPRRWPRRLPWIAGVLFALAGVLYLFVTSQTFLETFVLPKVATALGTSVTVGDADISPFRKVTLRDLKVGGGSFEDPIITAREVRARYGLLDIIGGNINIEEVALVSPVVQIVQLEDGTSNLDPLLNRPSQEPVAESPTSSAPPQLQLGRFILTNAVVRHIRHLAAGGREVAELSDVNISVANLRNAQVGSLNLAASIRFERTPGQNSTNLVAELIAATLNAQFELGLTADLKPESLRGSATLDLTTPPVAARDIKGTVAVLDCDLTPTDLRQLTLTFKQAGNTLGQVSAKGPFDLERKEGQINLEITSIGRQALNLAGAATGLDFGATTLNSTQQITIAQAGNRIATVGRLAADRLSIAQNGAATQPLDLAIAYDIAYDREKNSAVIQHLSLSGVQNATPIIRGKLQNTMRLDLGGGTNSLEPSAFNLQVTNLNLADWRAFIGDVRGLAVLNLDVTAADRQLGVQLNSRITDLSAVFGSNKVRRANVDLSLRGAIEDMKAFQLDDFLLAVRDGSQPAVTLAASAKGDLQQARADVNVKLDTDFVRLTNIVPIAGLPAANLKLDSQVLQRDKAFYLTNFTAHLQQPGQITSALTMSASYDLASSNGAVSLRLQSPDVLAFAGTNRGTANPVSVDATLNAALQNNIAVVRELAGKLTQNGRAGGSFTAGGEFNLATRKGRLALNLNDLNEAALGPLLHPALGSERSLKSCSLNLKTDGQYDQAGASSLTTELQLARLLIDDRTGKMPSIPVGAVVKLAASMRDGSVALESFAADLSSGDAVAGQIRASGKYNVETKAAEGNLRIVDVTEKLIAPFVTAMLTNKQLSSVAINADLAGRYNPAGDIAAKGEVNVSNLLFAGPGVPPAQTPLFIGLDLNAGMGANNLLNIETLRLKLAPTARARNELSLSGKLDLARTNAYSGDLLLFADSLDLTPYYDMISQTNRQAPAATTTTQSPAPVPPPGTSPSEPAPVNLPFGKFNFGLSIGQLYLRDLAIQNWQTTVALNGSRINVAPLQLSINGAPVKGEVGLNLGIPGYQYDVSVNATRVPVSPFADSFAPEQKGKVKGDVILATHVKGSGVTGRSLQKNLAGDVSFSFTNANFKMTGGAISGFFSLIGRFIGVPDLAESPISWLAANARISSGNIDVSQFNVVSETFTADSKGNIRIADLVAESPLEKWPMSFWLRRSIAQRLGRIPRNTPPDAQYVKMPDFIRVAGTVSAPKPELNRAALAGAVAEKFLDKALPDRTGSVSPLNPLAK